jgi:hypothetical protein
MSFPGPKQTFSLWPIAGVQLHQSGHSSIAQHLWGMKVGSEQEADTAKL